jgi:Ca2+-binding EF-hand superfamily protein
MGGGHSHVISFSQAQSRLGAEMSNRVKACFSGICGGEDGQMSEVQFVKYAFNAPIPVAISKALFNILDLEGKGVLELKDFFVGVAVFLAGTVEEKLGWVFEMYDLDRDGFVNRTDMKSMLGADLILTAIPLQEISKVIEGIVFEAMPTDGGGLEKPDFINWLRQRSTQLSLATWALDDKPSTKILDGVVSAAVDESKFEKGELVVDPIEKYVASLKYGFKSSEQTSLDFLSSFGYSGSNFDNDERKLCEFIASSKDKANQMVAWAVKR